MRCLKAALASVLLAGACTGAPSPIPPTASNAPPGAAATTPLAPGASVAQAPTPPAGQTPSRAGELGLADIELVTPMSGGGSHPRLEWRPVPGAVRYHVFVLAPSGRVYWGWRTSDTSIPVGGLPQLSEGAAGPAVSAGMTWSVSAVDAEGRVIGLSGHRPISP